jgi:hypothetical protein
MRQEKQMKFDSLSDRLGAGNVDGADCHFAFRTDDFDGVLAALSANGFHEDAAEDDPMHVIVRRNGPAAFPSSSCSIPTATSSRSTAHRSHALRVSRRCERRLRREGSVIRKDERGALLSKACAGLRHTARLGAKYPTRPSSKLVASSPDNIFATADFHDFH